MLSKTKIFFFSVSQPSWKQIEQTQNKIKNHVLYLQEQIEFDIRKTSINFKNEIACFFLRLLVMKIIQVTKRINQRQKNSSDPIGGKLTISEELIPISRSES